MTRVWRLLALGVGAYLLVLVTTFPAGRVSGMLQDQVAELSLNGVSGTAFSGQAAQVVYQGLDLGPVHWRFRPLTLLLGRLEYRIELTHPGNHGQFNVAKTLAGRTTIHDLELEVLPERLINHYSPTSVNTGGTVRLVFDTVNPDADYSGEVNGRLVWQDAVILEPLSLVLGRLELEVVTDDGELVGRFVDGGDLGISGEMALSATYAYRVNLLLRPVKDIGPDTQALLERNSAQRQPNGDYRIDTSGQL